MLGSRTRQVNSYGKRSVRVISDDRPTKQNSIFDETPLQWKPVASKMKKRENELPKKSKVPSPRAVGQQKSKLSPLRAHVAKKLALASQTANPQTPLKYLPARLSGTPVRTPLASYSANIPASPALSKHPTSIKPAAVKPVVEVEIITLDDDGQAVKKERRVSHPKARSIGSNVSPLSDDAQFKHRKPFLRRGEVKRVVSDDESDQSSCESVHAQLDAESPPRKPKRSPQKRAQPRRVVSDEDSVSEDDTPIQIAATRHSVPAAGDRPAAPNKRSTLLPTSIRIDAAPTKPRKQTSTPEPTPALPSLYPTFKQADSFPKQRQLTPIRGRKPLFQPPSPPSPTTPSDLSFEFDELDLEECTPSPQTTLAGVPEYLQPLLEECNQGTSGIHEFSAFIESFQFDPVVRSRGRYDLQFRKIGEASYSEVFGIGDVVLKIVPIRDELATSTNRKSQRPDDVEVPFSTDAKDVLKEIIVTRAMGQVCDGFVELLKSYVVRGRYPEVLLELWDEYFHRKGSENIRPDTFTLSQVYCIIVLPNGGPDLEAFAFPNPTKTGWRQACSIFWQVAKALAHAEKLVSFEHRDLHLGQILVKTRAAPALQPLQEQPRNQPARKPRKLKMDDPAHGVVVTLIDLGLARMDAGDGCGGEMIHWTPFDKEIFMGEGDYQFDIYRMMRAQNGDKWEHFNPLTNVMWLHYLIVKLIGFKNLKAPPTRKRPPTAPEASTFTDKECYECLVDLEDWLRKCLTAVVPVQTGKKGKKKTQISIPQPSGSISPLCAGEVVEYGIKKKWIKTIS